MRLNKNNKISRRFLFQIAATISSIFLVNYLLIIGIDRYVLLIPFFFIQFLLYLLNPLCAFVFCFVMSINIMQVSQPLWLKPLVLLFFFSVFFFNLNLLFSLLKNRKLRNVLYCSLLFSVFILITNFWNNVNLNSTFIYEQVNILFGFLIFLPAYYFTIRQPKNLFLILSAVATCFLIFYFSNLIFNLKLLKIGELRSSIESNLTRFAGYDLRQFIIFFIFLIPAFLFTKAVSTINRYFIIAIGISAFLVLILAIYRLAMFYNFLGLLLSLYFIAKYIKTERILKRFVLIAFFIVFLNYFLSEYIIEFQKVYMGTFEYFTGQVKDQSADQRFLVQAPKLFSYISNNFWTGCGLFESTLMTRKEMFGFVDYPILGSFVKFGFIGMIIYYTRFYFILKNKNQFTVRYFSSYNEQHKLVLYIYLCFKAYIISLITFRLFYITWELAFDWQQIEFGLFIGIYLALEMLLIENENIIFRNIKHKSV